MGQFFSSPHEIHVTEQKKFSHVLGSTQGYRQSQEDSYRFMEYDKVKLQDKQVNVKLFGIFDGHGGNETSKFISNRLFPIIVENLERDDGKSFKTVQGLVQHHVINAFFETDLELFKHFSNYHNRSGSTAIVALILDDEDLYSINIGDSRLILSKNGHVKNLSFDHKPNYVGELIRINDSGNTVQFNRVNGILALSRAFGDFDFKNLNNRRLSRSSSTSSLNQETITFHETAVTVEPDIIYHRISQGDEFIILACDGIYEVYSNDDLIGYIRHHLALGLKLDEIVDRIFNNALDNLCNHQTGNGFDNMSIYVIVIQNEGETLDQWYERMKIKIEIEKDLT